MEKLQGEKLTGTSIDQSITKLRGYLDSVDWSGLTPSRERIAEDFLRLAVENGLQSVTMRMLGKTAGIKASSVYSHFPGGRDEIVATTLRLHFHRFSRALLQEVGDITDPEDFWKKLIRVHLSRQIQLPESNLWDIIIASDRMTKFLPANLREEIDQALELHEDLYHAAAGALGNENSETVRMIITLLEGASRWYDGDTDGEGIENTIDRTISLTFNLLKVTPATPVQ